MVSEPLRIEERFIPGEYLIKAYPELWFDRRKGYAGFLTNLRLFFGDGRQLHDLSLRSVDALTWRRARRWSVWVLLLSLLISLIFATAPFLVVLLWIILTALWWFWMEEALVMRVGPRQVVIFGTPRTLNDIARNIRLHQAVLRSGEAGGALGQRILEAMPLGPGLPPSEGGPLAASYSEQVARAGGAWSDTSGTARGAQANEPGPDTQNELDHDHDPGTGSDAFSGDPEGKKKPEMRYRPRAPFTGVGPEGPQPLNWLERQATLKNRGLATRLAYRLWAGRPNPTRLLLFLAHFLLMAAIAVFVVADTVAFLNEEAASPFTRFAQLLVLGGLGALLGVILRQMDNRYRGVEPRRREVILKLGYHDLPLRVITHRVAHFLILGSLALTFLLFNLSPFLWGAMLGSITMAGGRIVNLLTQPQWLHLTRPWPKWRTTKLGLNVVRVFVVIIVVSIVGPYFRGHDAMIPAERLDRRSGNGWELAEKHTFQRGLGTVQGSLRIYRDDGRDAQGHADGYPALMVLITLKEPQDFLLKDILQFIDEGVQEQLRAQNVEELEVLANQSRTTVQGYTTYYTIYNATTRGTTFFTDGEKVRIIGEGWYAHREKLMVVAVGLAQISEETLDKSPEPPETDDYPGKDLVEAGQTFWEELVRQNEIPMDPTNTTNEQNWLELLGLVPTITAT